MSDRRRIFQTLVVSNLVLMFGFQVWQTVFNNLAVEELGLEARALVALLSLTLTYWMRVPQPRAAWRPAS